MKKSLTKTGINKKKELESKFQKEAIKLIREMGGHTDKIHVSAFQSQGTSDLVCCYKGRYVAFELKVDNNKPSELQQIKMESVIRAGGIAKPVWTLKEIEETLYEIFRLQQGDKS